MSRRYLYVDTGSLGSALAVELNNPHLKVSSVSLAYTFHLAPQLAQIPAPTPDSCAAKTDVITLTCDASHVNIGIPHMMTAAQLRAARALVGMDQRDLAAASGLSLPTIQRMEASEGVIRGNVDSLMKLIAALEFAGVELINEGAVSEKGGRGIRLKTR